jgi:hypothetical protein
MVGRFDMRSNVRAMHCPSPLVSPQHPAAKGGRMLAELTPIDCAGHVVASTVATAVAASARAEERPDIVLLAVMGERKVKGLIGTQLT